MNLEIAATLTRRGRLRVLWHATSLFNPFYRITFLASAARSGLLRVLAAGPTPPADLAAAIALDPALADSLVAWLDLGVELGDLGRGPSGYSLKSYLARALASPANDDVAALVEEVASFHHRLILETPARWRRGDPWAPFEHDGVLLSRSCRILEPFVLQVLDRAIPESGPVHLLEVGCGAGTYLRHVLLRNPDMTAVGVEVRPSVAAEARKALSQSGLAERVRIEALDIRDRPPDPSFDVVTLHNAIYYFPRDERVALLAHLAAFLKPGGSLLLTTSCRGGSSGTRVLDLWTSSTRGFGPLPTEPELRAQLAEAGLADLRAHHVIPGEPYVALVATKAPAAPAR